MCNSELIKSLHSFPRCSCFLSLFFFLSFFFPFSSLLNGWLTGCSSGEPHSWRVFVVEKTLYKKNKKLTPSLTRWLISETKKKGKRSRMCFQDKVCFQNRKNPSWINNDTSIQPTESVKVKRFSCQKESCDPSHRFWCIPSYCGRTNCSLSRLFHPASPAPTVLWVHFYPALFKEGNLQINAALSGTFSEWNACWESR